MKPHKPHLIVTALFWLAGVGANETTTQLPSFDFNNPFGNRLMCHAGIEGFSVVKGCEDGVVNCRTIKMEQTGAEEPLVATSCGVKEAKSGCENGTEGGVTHCYCDTILCNDETAGGADIKQWVGDMFREAFEAEGISWDTIDKDQLPESLRDGLESVLDDEDTRSGDDREPVTCFEGPTRASMTKTTCKKGIQSCSYKFKADGSNEISGGCFFPGSIAEICTTGADPEDPGKSCVCAGNKCNDPALIEDHREEGAGPAALDGALLQTLMSPVGTAEVSKEDLEAATVVAKNNLPPEPVVERHEDDDDDNGTGFAGACKSVILFVLILPVAANFLRTFYDKQGF